MKYRLGIDLGTNSIGWAMLALDEFGHPSGILGQGVRIFADGRKPKDGSSLAKERRISRGMRRRRDRYLGRRKALMDTLIALGLMPPDEAGRKGLEALDPYALRAKAVYHPLTPLELGRALFHLNQRRGFKSNRKTDGAADHSKIQPRIDELRQRISQSGAKSLGEYLHKRRLKGKMVRARPEAGFYPDRALYEAEFDEIRNTQAPHHTLRGQQWDQIRDIVFFQRPLKAVEPGWCLLEDGEKRAHRALPLAQEFRMVQDTNNLRIHVPGEPQKRLTQEQRDKVLGELRTKKELKLERLTRLLKLPSGVRINLLDENRKAFKGDETAARLSHEDLFGKEWLSLPIARRTEIVHSLLALDNPEDVERIAQAEWGLNALAAKKLSTTTLPEGYARLSEKAIAKLLPIMEERGLSYAHAVDEVPEFGHHSDFRPDQALDTLPYYGAILSRHVVGGDVTKPQGDAVAHYGRIANPTVHIGLGQLRRVVNRLIQAYGKPEAIVVELARDLKMSQEEKDEVSKTNRKNEAANELRKKQIQGAGGVPSAHLLRKLRLWEEQGDGSRKVCPFTGSTISFPMAISDATEIEHILPFSKTLDDSMANKVLCLRDANRAKRDRSPYEAFHSNPKLGKFEYDYAAIQLRAEGLPPNKRWRFQVDAMERFADESAFLGRQLNETQYLSRIARTYLAHLYNEKAEGTLRVRVIPGKLTAMLRGKWGLNSLLRRDASEGSARKNRDDHRHHALDAFVVAATDQRLLKALSTLNSQEDRNRLIEAVPRPWDAFTPDALRPHLERMIVSHRPDHGTFGDKRKTTGSLHNDTAYGLVEPTTGDAWKVVSRHALGGVKKRDQLGGVRDSALRVALEGLWDEVALAGGKPGEFAKRAEEEGVVLGGRKMKVRRVRMVETLSVVQIKDLESGVPYKAYKPAGNAFGDIYQLPNGKWQAVVVRTFEANQAGFDPVKVRPHPGAKRIMRLHVDDMVALEDAGRRRILRVVSLSDDDFRMAEHFEGGALEKRHTDRGDPFTWMRIRAAGRLKKLGLRKVGVDEIGRLTDPGPRTSTR